MSRVVDLVCLANSIKLRGRCVAGIDRDTGEWIRPVATTTHGELHPEHYMLGAGGAPRVLDVIRIRLERAHPLAHQPENWLISAETWQLLHRPSSTESMPLLHSHLTASPSLFGDTEHRIALCDLEQRPAAASLALIEPQGLQWFIERSQYNPKRPRAHFALGNAFYDLPVTDPAWIPAFRHLDYGLHPARACGLLSGQKLLLTISLGDEFECDGYCYKLVSGLVCFHSVL
jgi:hypothetical protein